jgi:D-2-hydroxyacid dehydrogenase (NADP+)
MNILIARDTRKELGKMYEVREDHLEKIQKEFPGTVINALNPDDPKFYDLLKDADYLISSHFNSNFEDAPKLKLVHITSAGVGEVPKKLIEQNVLVTNSSGVHPIPISEHVFAYMLMFARQINKTYKNQVMGNGWIQNFNELNIFELTGKTICIVGLGRIGSRIASLAKAFDMKVLGVVRDPDRQEEFVDHLFGSRSLTEAIKNADFVVNCLPHTQETVHLFDKEVFDSMKAGAYFINIGRGQTVNEGDLIEALENKKIAGAGLDVFEKEPLTQDSPLWKMENVIVSPHYSGWTPHYMDRVIDIFCDNLKAHLSHEKLPNLVDLDKGY